MSHQPPPDPVDPLNITVTPTIGPDWLRRAVEREPREPWYYGFLEKYAQILKAFSLVVFGLFAVLVLAPLLFPGTTAGVRDAAVGVVVRGLHPAGAETARPRSHLATERLADEVVSFALRLSIGLAVVGFVFFAWLLPVLLSVAFILLAVDAGRNLRARRREGRPPA